MSDRIPKLNSLNVNIIPTAVGTECKYQNDILKNRSIVSVIFGYFDNISAVLVTDSSSTIPCSIINTINYKNDYWTALINVYYISTTGEIKFIIKFMGSSQSLNNLRITKILYS